MKLFTDEEILFKLGLGEVLAALVRHPAMAGNTVNLETLIVSIGVSHEALGQQLKIRLMTNGNTT